jgi:hypothetical protein
MNRRYEVKCKLVRLLHAKQWDATLIRQFFLVIDWMMALPPELAVKLSTFIDKLEEGKRMEYISSYERVKLAQKFDEGEQKGTTKMLIRLLTRRFGNLPPATQTQISQATIEQIDAWFDRAMDAPTLGDVFQGLAH